MTLINILGIVIIYYKSFKKRGNSIHTFYIYLVGASKSWFFTLCSMTRDTQHVRFWRNGITLQSTIDSLKCSYVH